jgi:hypothetical protein
MGWHKYVKPESWETVEFSLPYSHSLQYYFVLLLSHLHCNPPYSDFDQPVVIVGYNICVLNVLLNSYASLYLRLQPHIPEDSNRTSHHCKNLRCNVTLPRTFTMSCIRLYRNIQSSLNCSFSKMSWRLPLGQYSVSRHACGGSTQAPRKRTRWSWCRSRICGSQWVWL